MNTSRRFKKRRYSKRYVLPRLRGRLARINKTNVHSFIRWEPQDDPTIIDCNFGSAGTSPYSRTFSLDKVANHSEFTALYDQYKITGIKIYMDYSPDVAMVGGAANSMAYFPKLWIKRDYDDAATPTLTQMTESNMTKCIRFNSVRTTYSMFIKPATLATMYRTSLTSAYGSQWNKWIDCNNADVPHYGIKFIAQGLQSTNLGAITLRFKYYLTFKNVR